MCLKLPKRHKEIKDELKFPSLLKSYDFSSHKYSV